MPNPLQPLLDQLPKPMRNKYFVVLAAFFFWMVFFDKQDIITQWRLQRMVNRLETDREYYSAEVKKADLESKDIQENRERLAREQYYMKRPDEDVFIIVEE